MDIAQYHRNVRRTATAGNVIANPSNSWGELERMGNTLTKFGFALAEQELKAEYNDQMSTAALEVDKAYEELRKGFTPDNTDEWEGMKDKMHESLEPTLAKILTNGKAQADFSPYFERQKFNQGRSLTNERRSVRAENHRRNYYRGFVESQNVAANQSLPADFKGKVIDQADITYGFQLKEDVQLPEELIDITEENFDKYFEPKEGYESPMFDSLEHRRSELLRWYRGTKEKYEVVQRKNISRELLGLALAAEDGEFILDNANAITEDKYGFEKLFDLDEIDGLKR